jgi:hypothetical protein
MPIQSGDKTGGYELHSSRLTVNLVLGSGQKGQRFTFTNPSNHQVSMVVTLIKIHFEDDELDSIDLRGPGLRSDGTEIPWQRQVYRFVRSEAAAMPTWLTDLLAHYGWSFRP